MADVPHVAVSKSPEETAEKYSPRVIIGALAGPALGLVIWFAPLRAQPAAIHALSIMVFMVVYW
ncbi:MAG: hypothetical protein ACREAC_28775, partial [Blastocatellia bacterium]